MSHLLFDRHQVILEQAVQAIETRAYWSAFPEMPSPKAYGEAANEEGKAAFEARLHKPFAIAQPGEAGGTGGEISPFGQSLGVKYPSTDIDALIAAVHQAGSTWRNAGPEAWVGVSLEILHRLNKRSFEIAYAVMHTTGQAFMMAFQAGGPHAQDRGLEVWPTPGLKCAGFRSNLSGRSHRARTSRSRWKSSIGLYLAVSAWSSDVARSLLGIPIPGCSRALRLEIPSS